MNNYREEKWTYKELSTCKIWSIELVDETFGYFWVKYTKKFEQKKNSKNKHNFKSNRSFASKILTNSLWLCLLHQLFHYFELLWLFLVGTRNWEYNLGYFDQIFTVLLVREDANYNNNRIILTKIFINMQIKIEKKNQNNYFILFQSS